MPKGVRLEKAAAVESIGRGTDTGGTNTERFGKVVSLSSTTFELATPKMNAIFKSSRYDVVHVLSLPASKIWYCSIRASALITSTFSYYRFSSASLPLDARLGSNSTARWTVTNPIKDQGTWFSAADPKATRQGGPLR